MTDEREFKQEWLCEPPGDTELCKAGLLYHFGAEFYDQIICTRFDANGFGIPEGQQTGRSVRYAMGLQSELAEDLKRREIDTSGLKDAIGATFRDFQKMWARMLVAMKPKGFYVMRDETDWETAQDWWLERGAEWRAELCRLRARAYRTFKTDGETRHSPKAIVF